MALIRRCDRCHREHPHAHGKRVLLSDFDGKPPLGGTELCEGCVSQLKDWLAPIPKLANKAVT